MSLCSRLCLLITLMAVTLSSSALASLGTLQADRDFRDEIALCEVAESAAEQCACANIAFATYKSAVLAVPFDADDDHFYFHSAEERVEHYEAGWIHYAGHLACLSGDEGAVESSLKSFAFSTYAAGFATAKPARTNARAMSTVGDKGSFRNIAPKDTPTMGMT